MKTATFTPSMMYGDHHVLAVRQLLLALQGVADVYASSSFQIVEVEYDESKLTEDQIQSTLSEAGYLEELPVAIEFGSAPADGDGRPFFRHTAVFHQTGHTISFGQDVPDVQRPLWPCPGIER